MNTDTALFDAPVTVARPSHDALPIVIDSPHSGTHYPADFGYSAPFELLRRGEDLHVERLYARATEVGATFIAANFPRAYIDPNRLPTDIDEELLDAPWPVWDPALAADDEVVLPIQISGKRRSEITMPRGAADAEVEAAALANPAIQAYLSGNSVSVRKVIVVKDRIVNLVVG